MTVHQYIIDYITEADAFECCVDRINRFRGKRRKFFIGITNNASDTLKEHTINKKMRQMYLLCMTNNKDDAIKVGIRLLQHFEGTIGNINNVTYDENGYVITDDIVWTDYRLNFNNGHYFIYVMFH